MSTQPKILSLFRSSREITALYSADSSHVELGMPGFVLEAEVETILYGAWKK
jgi:hypothetical protein